MIPTSPVFALDIECYVNYFLVMIRNVHSGGAVICYEMLDDVPLCIAGIHPNLNYVTFNGAGYDFPILSLAMAGCNNATLKAASDDIILNGMKYWDVATKYGGVDLSNVDMIDLMEVAPGQAGLKIYAGRLNSKRLQDLPIEPSASITPADRLLLQDYCGNSDLVATIDLYRKLTPQLDLRREMSKEFGIDLRSKSDAQIAEAVIRLEVEKRIGHRVFRPEVHPAYWWHYTVPSWVTFQTPGMQHLLNVIREAEFSLSPDGSVDLPQALTDMRVRIEIGRAHV